MHYIPKRYISKKYPPIARQEIKAIRFSYNLSQSAFAKMINISVNSLQNYEIGRTNPSSAVTALFMFVKECPHVFKPKLHPTHKIRPFDLTKNRLMHMKEDGPL